MVDWRNVAIRTLISGVLAAFAAYGQNVLNDARKIADARKLFDTLQDDHSGCDVFPLKPHMLFSLRIQAGYLASLPSPLFQAPGQQWIALTRITSKEGNGAAPVYLSQVVQPPVNEDPKIEGSYWLGKGRYDAELLLFDSRGDVCRKKWEIDARLPLDVTEFKPMLADGVVGGSPGTGGTGAAPTRSLDRLTILLHAASVLQRQTVLGPLAKAMLMDGLVALMEELPAGSVRLVVFNLEQQRELLRKDGFTLRALPEVMQVLDALQPAAVDYSTLQKPGGNFIENLLNREMRASASSEAVVFLGPKSVYTDKPSAQFVLPPGSKQRFYYLECDPTHFLLPRSSTLDGGGWGPEGLAMGIPPASPMGRIRQSDIPPDIVWKDYGPNAGADSIEYAVGQLKGKTVQVDSARSFAAAVTEITRRSGTRWP